jgi:hypothetical protein
MTAAKLPHAPSICGAQTRAGTPCKTPPVRGRRRCRMHGGTSPGAPRGNQYAWKHGLYSAVALEERRRFSALLKQLKQGLTQLSEEPI